jgi:hypothetical protein
VRVSDQGGQETRGQGVARRDMQPQMLVATRPERHPEPSALQPQPHDEAVALTGAGTSRARRGVPRVTRLPSLSGTNDGKRPLPGACGV